jgi:serine/threonine protein kinase
MKNPRDDQSFLQFSTFSTLPQWAHSLSAIGPETAAVIGNFFREKGQLDESAFGTADSNSLKSFAAALASWSDRHAARMVENCIERSKNGETADFSAVGRWVILHKDDPESVLDCMDVDPPAEIDVIRVLSRAGSQKLVFEAVWRLTQKRVVLKVTRDPKTLARELRSNPLTLKHPNIIETHLLRNSKNESFLVEQWIPDVLRDDWQCQGIEEAANLLYNLADAVAYLHGEGLVHGDIKPDNIGKQDDAFILLDFGICRPASEFTGETTATGSLRTRAPELLTQGAYIDAKKVDVWAIGATVFNFLEMRFPLIDRGEYIPRLTETEKRAAFQQELLRRVEQEWNSRLVFPAIPEPLRHLVERALALNPEDRPTAAELRESASKDLTAFLRVKTTASRFAPRDQLIQFKEHLAPREILDLMPADEKRRLKNRLRDLQGTTGFSESEKRDIDRIYDLISA